MEAENCEKSLDSWATSQPSFSNFGEGCEVLFLKKFKSDFAQLRREITATNTHKFPTFFAGFLSWDFDITCHACQIT